MIYCVEDDFDLRELVVYALSAADFEVLGMKDAGELASAMEKETPELIILDIMLPGEDGISILKRLRADPSTAAIPIMMASAKGSEYDKVTGLDLGADDYLAKPFGMMEMISRVRALLRRSHDTAYVNAGAVSVGPLTLDYRRHEIISDGHALDLTLKEYELLKLLMENPGRVYTRDELLDIVWDMDFRGESRTVDVHIASLRSKLGPHGQCIETIRGVGYKLEEKDI